MGTLKTHLTKAKNGFSCALKGPSVYLADITGKTSIYLELDSKLELKRPEKEGLIDNKNEKIGL